MSAGLWLIPSVALSNQCYAMSLMSSLLVVSEERQKKRVGMGNELFSCPYKKERGGSSSKKEKEG